MADAQRRLVLRANQRNGAPRHLVIRAGSGIPRERPPWQKLPVVPSTTNAMSRLDTLGLFFATGSTRCTSTACTSRARMRPEMSAGVPASHAKVSRESERQPRPRMAVGSPGLLSLDAKLPTLSPQQASSPRSRPPRPSPRRWTAELCHRLREVHTLIVCIGIAFGRDTLGHGATAGAR